MAPGLTARVNHFIVNLNLILARKIVVSSQKPRRRKSARCKNTGQRGLVNALQNQVRACRRLCLFARDERAGSRQSHAEAAAKQRPTKPAQQTKNAAPQKSAVHRMANARVNVRTARDETPPRRVSMPVTSDTQRPAFGWPALVSEARKHMGTNPTDKTRLWCATFMNMVLAKTGYKGTNSDAAKSFAQYGRRISEPRSRRHRGADARQERRPCRRRLRRRRQWQSDHHFRQS